MGIVKEKIDAQKLRGGYYTPPEIARFLCNWAITNETREVLEPSCGDGIFVAEAIRRFQELGTGAQDFNYRLKGIELIEAEALKAEQRARELGCNAAAIIQADFFHYVAANGGQHYDVILGNPPFIRYQSFPQEHRELAIAMMKNLGLNPNRLTNIWVPFLVVSASLLKAGGRLAMVIPAELFQVKYAMETRVFLAEYFERITIITFKKLVFKDIQQEIVLLLCEKETATAKGIRVIECEHLPDLGKIDFASINGSQVKPIDHSTEKWTKYFLTDEEINLLKRLKNDQRVIPCGDILEIDVGLVTGMNAFFMLTASQVKEWGLEKYTLPVVSKSNQLTGIAFTEQDFRTISQTGQAVHLFIPPNADFEDLPEECRNYIRYGETKGFHQGYKCRIRKRWYITPSLWSPDGFALRQVNDYPKLVFNTTAASSTDTIHRVRFKTKVNQQGATAAFFNSLSFAFSEITGRSYGGGVMTFEPTEIEEIRIPLIQAVKLDFATIDKLVREREVEKALDLVDRELLIHRHGFTENEVAALRGIWRKLAARRKNRK